MSKQEKIEITLYTDVEPIYGPKGGGRLAPEPYLKQGLGARYPKEYRQLLERLITLMKVEKFSFKHYYDDGTVRDFEPWE